MDHIVHQTLHQCPKEEESKKKKRDLKSAKSAIAKVTTKKEKALEQKKED